MDSVRCRRRLYSPKSIFICLIKIHSKHIHFTFILIKNIQVSSQFTMFFCTILEALAQFWLWITFVTFFQYLLKETHTQITQYEAVIIIITFYFEMKIWEGNWSIQLNTCVIKKLLLKGVKNNRPRACYKTFLSIPDP